MRRTSTFCLFLILGLIWNLSAFGDGGVLRFVPSSDESRGVIWPVEDSGLYSFQSRHASLRLDKDEAEPVYMFELKNISNRLCLSTKEPLRIFSDLSGDMICQPDELISAASGESFFYYFKQVPIPVLVGDATQVLLCDLEVTSMMMNYGITLTRIHSFYEGEVTAGGEKFPARMGFRAALGDKNPTRVNEIFVLDTNRDGSFDHYLDSYLSSQGLVYLNERWYVATTVFQGERAEITLTPYPGLVGTLEVKGEGLELLRLRRGAGKLGEGLDLPEQEICVRNFRNSTQELPEGSYDEARALLRSVSNPDLFFQSSESRKLSTAIRITAGATSTLNMGGPLKTGIRVVSGSLSGKVELNYRGCKNQADHWFEKIQLSELQSGTDPPPPSYVVLDRHGKEIHSGKFAYG